MNSIRRDGSPTSSPASPIILCSVSSGRCPPEDVGGPWGYGEMLEALEYPGQESHAETLEWLGEDFDPHAFDAEQLKADVAALAKRWSRKPAAEKPRPA